MLDNRRRPSVISRSNELHKSWNCERHFVVFGYWVIISSTRNPLPVFDRTLILERERFSSWIRDARSLSSKSRRNSFLVIQKLPLTLDHHSRVLPCAIPNATKLLVFANWKSHWLRWKEPVSIAMEYSCVFHVLGACSSRSIRNVQSKNQSETRF